MSGINILFMNKGVQLLIIFIVALVAAVIAPVAVRANDAPRVLITEISPGSKDSATDEFVEIYNPSSVTIDLSADKIQYKSASGKTWTTKAKIVDGTELAPGQYMVLSSKDNYTAHLQSGMAQAAGNIRLVDAADAVLDQVGWGTADAALVAPAEPVPVGQTISRKLIDSAYAQSQNNFDDFLAGEPTPGSPTKVAAQSELAPAASDFSLDIIINELLPDPASPLTDSQDEFIELFNDGSGAQDLTGYSLMDASGHSFKLDGRTIGAAGYLVIRSAESKISLNNDGDTVKLVAPNGETIDITEDYGKAKSNLSWGRTGDGWSWTSAPTPGSANASVLIEQADTVNVAKTTTSKKLATKKTTARTNTARAKAAAKPANTSQIGTVSNEQGPNVPASNWSWLLITLGVATIGYGIYEYRPEITIFFHKLRAKLGLGQKARPKS